MGSSCCRDRRDMPNLVCDNHGLCAVGLHSELCTGEEDAGAAKPGTWCNLVDIEVSRLEG